MDSRSDLPRPMQRSKAFELAERIYRRFIRSLEALEDRDWERPTECPRWSVKHVAVHLLGSMRSAASIREALHQAWRAWRMDRSRPLVDRLNDVQVSERIHLTPEEIVGRLQDNVHEAVRGRRRFPRLLRRAPVTDPHSGPFTMGHLMDVVLTRDAWMHHIDIARATDTGVELEEDDRLIIADAVAEWSERHQQPFELHLHGPAGGHYQRGQGGETIEIDAVDFCRTLSGRESGHGLLAVNIPF